MTIPNVNIGRSLDLIATAHNLIIHGTDEHGRDVASDVSVDIMVELGYDSDDVSGGTEELTPQVLMALFEIVGMIAPDHAIRIADALRPSVKADPNCGLHDGPDCECMTRPVIGDITQFDFGQTVIQQVRSQFR